MKGVIGFVILATVLFEISLPPKTVCFIEVAFTRFYELFYLKYFNFKDWMKYTLKSF
jgi:hypothetical protein